MRNAWVHMAHTLRGPAAVAATKWHAKVVKGNESNCNGYGTARECERKQKPWPERLTTARQRWHKLITAGRKCAGGRGCAANGLRVRYELLARLFGRSGHIKLLVLRAELSSDTSELPGIAFYVSLSLLAARSPPPLSGLTNVSIFFATLLLPLAFTASFWPCHFWA